MPIGALSSRQQAVEAIWPIIQAEINKLNAEKAETIEVLEVNGQEIIERIMTQHWDFGCLPLLDLRQWAGAGLSS